MTTWNDPTLPGAVADRSGKRRRAEAQPPRPAPAAADPAALTALRDEIREATRQAHEALRDVATARKDMERVLKEYRDITARTETEVREAAANVAAMQLAEYVDHLQRQFDHQARILNESVDGAKQHIVSQLTLYGLEADPDVPGRLRFLFQGSPFNPNPTGASPENDAPPEIPPPGQAPVYPPATREDWSAIAAGLRAAADLAAAADEVIIVVEERGPRS